ncbi:MAG: hypothetical protein A3D50_01475 [Candidatus Taylorbacteria bacterium RIFCSPHIGHO2_02_FULL_44_12]|uniref:Uncharacterized protein n=1 Tax=Candidatus Taylorbacteria bacterium RIFCSPHIGHO2_02_FULL_44_12 TaxID=1802308 RepID=A0A1G2MKK5_9BACT|nr:MAG: hypothetical protein A3D50_01475 [Candidatus Taylorbacteria bacterium RIFCSPHIGHO2_02_FULL_44_12]
MKKNVVIATIRSWNIEGYWRWNEPAGYKKHLVTNPDQLTDQWLKTINPEFIFFPHWSWIIPENIYNKYECVVFHTADLPRGRGGSPIQNLIIRGIYKTKVSALQVTGGLDEGPIYAKVPLDISKGSAQEIFQKNSIIVYKMISEILKKHPKPRPQKGKVLIFKRRKPSESLIPEGLSTRKLYDFIRMLDADGYPRAYIETNGYILEFNTAAINNESVTARVIIKPKKAK